MVLPSLLPTPVQPEAALPPPFPTAKPRRAYISNMAVLQQYRRRGVATALLRQCERMARLWRRDSLWLHVDLRNQAAIKVRLVRRSRHCLQACYLQPLAARCLASAPCPILNSSLTPPSSFRRLTVCLPQTKCDADLYAPSACPPPALPAAVPRLGVCRGGAGSSLLPHPPQPDAQGSAWLQQQQWRGRKQQQRQLSQLWPQHSQQQ